MLIMLALRAPVPVTATGLAIRTLFTLFVVPAV
jgi:hypothetical protein